MSKYYFLFTLLLYLQINIILCQNNNKITFGTTSRILLKKSHIMKRDLSSKNYDDQFDVIDVASFIQKPDYYSLDQDTPEEVNAEQENSQEIESEQKLEDTEAEEVTRKNNTHYIKNENENLKESINDEINDMISRNGFVNTDDNIGEKVHANCKKAADLTTIRNSGYRGIKFPFFSHSKSEPKVKKKTKHSLIINSNDDTEKRITEIPFKFHKKKKRSHSESCKCKLCKKRRIKKMNLQERNKRKHIRQRNKYTEKYIK